MATKKLNMWPRVASLALAPLVDNEEEYCFWKTCQNCLAYIFSIWEALQKDLAREQWAFILILMEFKH